MNLHGRLAALFVIPALGGCAQVATGQAPSALYSLIAAARTCLAAGVVEAAVACSGQSVRKSTGTPPRATGFDDPHDAAEPAWPTER
jgi:hypothetical protein